MICYIITSVKLPMSMLFFVMLVLVIAMAAAAVAIIKMTDMVMTPFSQ